MESHGISNFKKSTNPVAWSALTPVRTSRHNVSNVPALCGLPIPLHVGSSWDPPFSSHPVLLLSFFLLHSIWQTSTILWMRNLYVLHTQGRAYRYVGLLQTTGVLYPKHSTQFLPLLYRASDANAMHWLFKSFRGMTWQGSPQKAEKSWTTGYPWKWQHQQSLPGTATVQWHGSLWKQNFRYQFQGTSLHFCNASDIKVIT